MKNKCGGCEWFVSSAQLDQGECHYDPPRVLLSIAAPQGANVICGWPTIKREAPGCRRFSENLSDEKLAEMPAASNLIS
jgi:hypothetical protein